MSDEPAYRDGIGGNQPANPAETFVTQMQDALIGYRARRAQFLERLDTVKIRDRTSAGSAADIIGLAAGVEKLIQEERMKLTQPLQDAIAAIIATARNFWEPVNLKIGDPRLRVGDAANAGTVYGKIRDWEAENAKKVREQQQQQAAEEAAFRARTAPEVPVVARADEEATEQPGAPASRSPRAELQYNQLQPVGDKAQAGSAARDAAVPGVTVAAEETAGTAPSIRGDLGHRLSARKSYLVTIVDVKLLPDFVLNSPKVREAIIAVGKSLAPNMPAIPGLKIEQDSTTRVSK